jgi:hypothetical protein
MTTVTVSQPQLEAQPAEPGLPIGVVPTQGPVVVVELGIRGPAGLDGLSQPSDILDGGNF